MKGKKNSFIIVQEIKNNISQIYNQVRWLDEKTIFFRSCQFVDLLQEDGNAGAFLDHNKNLKKDDVRQTKRGLQRFSVFSGQECRKRRERDTDE